MVGPAPEALPERGWDEGSTPHRTVVGSTLTSSKPVVEPACMGVKLSDSCSTLGVVGAEAAGIVKVGAVKVNGVGGATVASAAEPIFAPSPPSVPPASIPPSGLA